MNPPTMTLQWSTLAETGTPEGHVSALRLLADAAAELLSATDPNEMVTRVFERASDYLGCDIFFNYMVREKNGDRYLSLDVSAGLPEASLNGFRCLEFGQSLCGQTAQKQAPQIVFHLQHSDNPMAAAAKQLGVRAYACHPLMVGHRLIGTLSFASRRKDEFTPKELNFMEAISHLIATAKERLHAEQMRLQSDDRFRRMIEASPIGIISSDLEGGIQMANQAFLDMVGYREEDVAQRRLRWTDLTPPEWLPKDAEGIAQARQKAYCDPYEKEYIRSDGTRVRVMIGYALFDEEHEECVAFVLDITEKKRTEDALKASETLFKTMAESIPQLAWITDASGYINWYNQRWYDFTGTSFEQMEGWGWEAVHHPEHLAHVQESWKRSLSTGTPWEDTFPLRDSRGLYRWFLSRAVPVHDNDGKIILWFGTNTDVTEQRLAEEAARASAARLRQAQDAAGIGIHE